ncbi:MAG: deoxyribodipyrimidine photo-lyase [Pseudomonadota bacterium]
MQVVWFKRDLRTTDHRPLANAARHGAVLPLYVIEPEFWRQPDQSSRHWDFVRESLAELQANLASLETPLVIRSGPLLEVLEALSREVPIDALWSHQETGTDWTFQRDRAVSHWCKAHGIPWHQPRQHGVERGPSQRRGWAKRWDQFMAEPLTQPPPSLGGPHNVRSESLPTSRTLRLSGSECPGRQQGGRRAAVETVETFFTHRGEGYRRAMSSPLSAEAGCSRISPHLAWGTLSLREVAQATWQRQARFKAFPRTAGRDWPDALKSFNGRLHWHCHFMQKLEDEPLIEFDNLHRAYDGLRHADADHAHLAAWKRGETGFPFVDACMRALTATGWINFRMRAMLMAVASYHLWLDWRQTGTHLATLFTDYEPGIHWPQVQMQSGTTGINALRIYNPVKQGYDQDPHGHFVRRWLPEIAAVPDSFIHEPWTWPDAASVLGVRYPFPIVDHLQAAEMAKRRLSSVRRSPGHRQEARKVYDRHGSRRRTGRDASPQPPRQDEFEFIDPETMA